MIIDKVPKPFNGEGTVFITNDARKTGSPHAKTPKLDPYFPLYTKTN